MLLLSCPSYISNPVPSKKSAGYQLQRAKRVKAQPGTVWPISQERSEGATVQFQHCLPLHCHPDDLMAAPSLSSNPPGAVTKSVPRARGYPRFLWSSSGCNAVIHWLFLVLFFFSSHSSNRNQSIVMSGKEGIIFTSPRCVELSLDDIVSTMDFD